MDTWEEYKAKNEEKFKSDVVKKFGDKFDLSKLKYINSKTDVCIICPIHGEITIKPQGFLKSDYGCPKCGKKIGAIARGMKQRKSTNDFIKDAIKVHGDKYIYTKANLEHRREDGKVCIICPKHGEFWQTPNNHLQGDGCKECAKESRSKLQIKEKTIFEKESRKVHGDKYDYTKSEYKGANKDICIICPIHGEFWQTPHNHLKGHGCPDCMAEKLSRIKFKSTEWFKEAAIKVHGDKDDLSKVIYNGTKNDICVICPKHGEYITTPNDYLNGHRCPKCAHHISKWEQEIYEYIVSLGIECEQSNRSILSGKEIDIYIPNLNIGIECNGLKWHSEEFKIDKTYHLWKTNECNKNGVRLIHIFEDEWVFKKNIWQSMLKNLFGLIDTKIYARKCEIREVSPQETRTFLDNNHIQGYSTSKINYGLYYNDELVSLMTFGIPRINMGGKKEDGCYELVRFCNKLDINVIGGASKLFKHFIEVNNPNEIVSYSDKRWSLGNLYSILGFVHDHDSRPNYFYVNNMERLNRFGFRKSVLVNEGYDKDKTEHEIMQERGIYRIYDCGTMVWKWLKNVKT
jgi:hypothetical protein